MDLTNYSTATKLRIATQTTSNTVGFKRLRNQLSRRDPWLPVKFYEHWIMECNSPLFATYNGQQTERTSRGMMTGRDAFASGLHRTGVGGTSSPCISSTSYMRDMSNRLIGKVRESPLNLGTSLGEYKETAEFLAGAMKTSSRVIHYVKKGNFAAALRQITNSNGKSNMRDVFEQTANAHLAAMYGLKPLAMDAYNATNVLSNEIEQPLMMRIFVRGINIDEFLVAKDGTRYINELSLKVKGRGCIQVEVVNDFLFTLDKLGILSPESLGWELLPLSFVLDYYAPFGKYFQGIRPPQGIGKVSGWLSFNMRAKWSSETNIPTPAPGWKTKAYGEDRWKHRDVITAFPQFWYENPDISLSKSQILTSLALLVQATAR